MEEFVIKGKLKEEDDGQKRESLSYLQDAMNRLRKNKIAMLSAVLLIIILLIAIFGPIISPYGYEEIVKGNLNKGPSLQHIFGTDTLGRDLFTRIAVGAQVSLFIAFVAAIINVVIGVIYGGVSGYFGGKVDLFMMRFVEIIYSIPNLLWVIMLTVVLGPGLQTIIISIAVTGWGGMARIVRGQILSLKQSEYVLAAKVLGAGGARIIRKHMLPNIMGPIIIELTFSIPTAIFTEATLSYLGLGLPVPLASWGTLANEGARLFIRFPHQLIFPAIFISLTMLSFNLLGDGLRDALDPRLRR